jgi:hypothetical protein
MRVTCRYVPLVVLLWGLGCRAQIDWRDHASFRASRTDLSLSHIGPEELVENAPHRTLSPSGRSTATTASASRTSS